MERLTQKSRRTIPKSPYAKREEVIALMKATDMKREMAEERREEIEITGKETVDMWEIFLSSRMVIPPHLQQDTRPQKKRKSLLAWLWGLCP